MKKNYFFILLFLISYSLSAQRSVKIGYIDTEYILENLPEYNQVSERLEEKAAGWKKEIEDRTRQIDQKKEALNSERILLTNEMIDEIEEEIILDEEDLSEYQQKRFGPRGDLIIQKQQLIQPIQDQIFNAIRELAESKNEVKHRNYPAISSYHFNPARILIVDDIPYNRDYLESFLSRWSFTVDTAINGEDALKKIEQHQPDLIIMDFLQ